MTYRKQITDTVAVLRSTERMVFASDDATDGTLWVAVADDGTASTYVLYVEGDGQPVYLGLLVSADPCGVFVDVDTSQSDYNMAQAWFDVDDVLARVNAMYPVDEQAVADNAPDETVYYEFPSGFTLPFELAAEDEPENEMFHNPDFSKLAARYLSFVSLQFALPFDLGVPTADYAPRFAVDTFGYQAIKAAVSASMVCRLRAWAHDTNGVMPALYAIATEDTRPKAGYIPLHSSADEILAQDSLFMRLLMSLLDAACELPHTEFAHLPDAAHDVAATLRDTFENENWAECYFEWYDR